MVASWCGIAWYSPWLHSLFKSSKALPIKYSQISKIFRIYSPIKKVKCKSSSQRYSWNLEEVDDYKAINWWNDVFKRMFLLIISTVMLFQPELCTLKRYFFIVRHKTKMNTFYRSLYICRNKKTLPVRWYNRSSLVDIFNNKQAFLFFCTYVTRTISIVRYFRNNNCQSNEKN